jgi:hypothetical protein
MSRQYGMCHHLRCAPRYAHIGIRSLLMKLQYGVCHHLRCALRYARIGMVLAAEASGIPVMSDDSQRLGHGFLQ